MNDQQLEHLTRALTNDATRRGTLAVLAGLVGFGASESLAERRHRGKITRHARQGRAAKAAKNPTAAAAKPIRDVEEPYEPFDVEDQCSFTVHVETEGAVASLVWDDGMAIYTAPGFQQTFTNVDTGKSIFVVPTGPGIAKPDGLTFVATGPWTWWPHPVTEEPGIYLMDGNLVNPYADDARFKGKTRNLCAELES